VPLEMPVKVADASALAALLFGEIEGERVSAALSSDILVAPGLLPYEIANTAVMKLRRGEIDIQTAEGSLPRLALMRVELRPVTMDMVLVLAHDTGLTAYDASYLWLARELDCQLVTLDKKLHAAAGPLAAP
jgi:predicted nucleic acid-binding protein